MTQTARAIKFVADSKAVDQIMGYLDELELEGQEYLDFAHELLARHGFTYTAAPCSCEGKHAGGQYGHAFWCGYTREAV